MKALVKLDECLRIAKRAGADIIIDGLKQDAVDEVRKLTCDLGAAPTLTQAVQMVRPGGKVGIIGAHPKDYSFDSWSVLTKEVSIIPVFSYAKWGTKVEFEIALELLAAGKLNAMSLITHKFRLTKINDAFLTAIN